MPDLDDYFDEIDSARAQRARELSDIKFFFSARTETDPNNIRSKSTVVLSYASWEGFYNQCVHAYIEFLRMKGGKIRDTDWMLFVGVFERDFESLRARHHSSGAKRQFVTDLKLRLESRFDEISIGVVEARSNLNYERLSENFEVLSFDLTPIQPFRIRIDKELVGWRHGIAHGDAPDLSSMDISKHVDFTNSLLIVIADCFQNAMLDRV